MEASLLDLVVDLVVALDLAPVVAGAPRPAPTLGMPILRYGSYYLIFAWLDVSALGHPVSLANMKDRSVFRFALVQVRGASNDTPQDPLSP